MSQEPSARVLPVGARSQEHPSLLGAQGDPAARPAPRHADVPSEGAAAQEAALMPDGALEESLRPPAHGRSAAGLALESGADTVATERDRLNSMERLMKLGNAIQAAHFGVMRWQQQNLHQFVGQTGGAPDLSLGEHDWVRLVERRVPMGLESGAGTSVEWVARTLGSELSSSGVKASVAGLGVTLGRLATGAAGFVVGLAAGVVFNLLANLVFGPSRAARERLTHEATKRGAELAATVSDRVATQFQAQVAEWVARQEALRAWIRGGAPRGALAVLDTWMERQLATLDPPEANERSLYWDLLERWVLEHAGRPDRAHRDTNDASWQDAAEHLEGEQNRRASPHGVGQHGFEMTEGGLRKPDLYRDQCRREWHNAGLDPEPAVQSLEALMKRINAVARRPGRSVGLICSAPQVCMNVRDWRHTFDAARDDDRWQRFLSEELPTVGQRYPLGGRHRPLACDVGVVFAPDNGSVYITAFEYTIRWRDQGSPAIRTFTRAT